MPEERGPISHGSSPYRVIGQSDLIAMRVGDPVRDITPSDFKLASNYVEIQSTEP